jgi:hypothetical protein
MVRGFRAGRALAPSSRRDSEGTLERPIEGSLCFVSDLLGNARRHVALAQLMGGHLDDIEIAR